MVAPHEWTECRPVTFRLVGAVVTMGGKDRALMDAAVTAAWQDLSPADRQAFHRFCCLNARDLPALASIERFQRAIRAGLPVRLR